MKEKARIRVQRIVCCLSLALSMGANTAILYAEETPATEVPETIEEAPVEETEPAVIEETEEATEVPEADPTVEPTVETATEPEAPLTSPEETVVPEASATAEASVSPEESIEPSASASASPSASAETSGITFVLPTNEADYQWSAMEENQEVDLIAALGITATDAEGNEVEVTVKDNGGLDFSIPGEYTITIAAINPVTELEETTTFVLTINGMELLMPMSTVYDVQPGDTAAILRSKIQSGVDTIHFGPGTWDFTDQLNIGPADVPNGITFINDGTVNFNTPGAAMQINVGAVPVNFQGGSWNITTGGRGMNLWAQANGSYDFSDMNLTINSTGDNICFNGGWYVDAPMTFTRVNLTGVITSPGNEGNIQTDSNGPLTFTDSTVSLDSRNSGMFGPIYHAGNMIVTGSTMNLNVSNNAGIVMVHGGQLDITGGSTVNVTGNSTGGNGINATGPVIIDSNATVNVSGTTEGFGIYDSFTINGGNANFNNVSQVFVSKGASSTVTVLGNSIVSAPNGTTNVTDPANASGNPVSIIVDSGSVNIPGTNLVKNSNGEVLARFDVPYTTSGSSVNLGSYTYSCPVVGTVALWAPYATVNFYDQQYATYGTTGLLNSVKVIKGFSSQFSNVTSQIPSGTWYAATDASVFATTKTFATNANYYMITATPTPAPGTPTPGPRSCQDDGYPAGYYWNGTACVTDATPTPTPTATPVVTPTPTPSTSPSPSPTASAKPTTEPTVSPSSDPTFSANVNQGGTSNGNADQPRFGSPTNNWALLNLVFAAIALVEGIFILFEKRKKEETEEDENGLMVSETYERKPLWKVATIVLAIATSIIFVITENMTQPMVITDIYTGVMAVLAAVTTGGFILGSRWKAQKEESSNI